MDLPPPRNGFGRGRGRGRGYRGRGGRGRGSGPSVNNIEGAYENYYEDDEPLFAEGN